MASGHMTLNITADPEAAELIQIAREVAILRHQVKLLLTGLENVRVLSLVRDEDGEPIGLAATIVAPMLETGISS